MPKVGIDVRVFHSVLVFVKVNLHSGRVLNSKKYRGKLEEGISGKLLLPAY